MPRRFAIGSAQDLVQAERDIRARVGDSELDFAAMAAISNIYRAANAIRNHMEQKVLAEEDLSWAAFTVLFVLWIWGDQQTRHLAAEAGVTKGTLTGVLKTLEKRGLARRRGHDADGRLVLVSLEPKGQDVIERLFPAFNRGEAQVSTGLTDTRRTSWRPCCGRSSGRWRKRTRPRESGTGPILGNECSSCCSGSTDCTQIPVEKIRSPQDPNRSAIHA